MKRLILLLFVAISATGCSDKPSIELEQFSDNFLDWYFSTYPITATWIRIHDYDSRMDDVSPIPDEWSDEQSESFQREYNNLSVQILSIHEAIPGHYVQLYYSNRYPSIVRSVFGSGTFIEGWAHYAEQMMVDEGYWNNDPRMKLVQLKWRLRGLTNAIIDQKIHKRGMTEEEAVSLMMNEGFQEESEAKGKWIRAQLSSTQLSSYYVGSVEIFDLREKYKKVKGDKFSLKDFHENLLSHGSPPVKYLTELLLSDGH